MPTPIGLPAPIAARARLHQDSPTGEAAAGDFVLYWMRTAARAHDNPALDAALLLGRRLALPVFVYHALSERYPYASDRHHTFVLEGARDVQADLRTRGVGYAFHLERPGQRGPWLRWLAQRAAAVVTEDMPVEPMLEWTARLARTCQRPVWLVDTACLVPMQAAGKAWERAFTFRDATKARRQLALAEGWHDAPNAGEPFVPDLPFEPVELGGADLAELVAACAIDHTIAAVPATQGGARAGYARWRAFCANGLHSYHLTRTDPLVQGTSRMSAYLHYGHVSPFRIAREAAAAGGPGAEKFLDELLVWRELAHALCFFRADHATLGALPAWARATLREHETDRRPACHSWERLARGRTGDPLWDAAQRSLTVHGELHNNVRMTWGKAFLAWTPNPAVALQTAIDLNHRYALDGRDPASYGGLLWCFGAFDTPTHPERPVYGSVPERATTSHAKRLDVERYAARSGRAAVAQPPRIAVIGAGVSGLTCARTLSDHGLQVVVFDKARGCGGRASTRRHDDLAFDHGAQYFTARDPRFARWVTAWEHEGVLRRWDGTIVGLRQGQVTPGEGSTPRFVGVPGMSALTRHLAAECTLRQSFHVEGLVEERGGLSLVARDGRREGAFDAVVLAAPAPQTAALAASLSPALSARAETAAYAPCWAVMLAFASPLPLAFDGAFVADSPLSWVARNSSKPGRPQTECWVLHAAPEWSVSHFDDAPDAVVDALSHAFAAAAGIRLPTATSALAHRWAYALPTSPLPEECVFDASARVGACGDWCAGPRVEGAFLSGAALAGRLLAWAARRPAPRQGLLFS